MIKSTNILKLYKNIADKVKIFMIKQTIIVPAEGFVEWGGGIDYIKYLLRLLAKINRDDPTIKILLIIPSLTLVDKLIRLIKDCIKFIIRRPIYKKNNGCYNLFIADIEISNNVEIMKYNPYKKQGKNSIQQIVKKSQNPLVFPTMKPLENLSCKQIGYIYDLQHISLPHFFTDKECKLRDAAFKNILSRCDGVIVNSKDVKRHLLEVYPEQANSNKMFSTLYLPIVHEIILNQYNKNIDILKYNLPEKYFIISNQLWKHKDHKTAFKALQLLHEDGYNYINILCTGNTYDYRFPEYYNEMQKYICELKMVEYIRFLGYIDKTEQIAIMQNSIGVLQPTLFEGGPGGGAVYDAIACGVPAIVSDIPVNKEIEHPQVHFFRAQDSEDLAQKMIHLVNNQLTRPSLEELKTQRIRNIAKGAQFLHGMFSAI